MARSPPPRPLRRRSPHPPTGDRRRGPRSRGTGVSPTRRAHARRLAARLKVFRRPEEERNIHSISTLCTCESFILPHLVLLFGGSRLCQAHRHPPPARRQPLNQGFLAGIANGSCHRVHAQMQGRYGAIILLSLLIPRLMRTN